MENILKKITESNEELNTFLKKLKADNLNLLDAVSKACNAYSADIKIREKRIKEQIADLEDKKQKLTDAVEAMRPQFVNATASGNAENIKVLQKHMADLKTEESALDTQIEFLYSTPITGNQDLFDTATELNDKLKQSSNDLKMIYKSLIKVAEHWKDAWENLYEEFLYSKPGALSNEYNKISDYHNTVGKCVEKTDNKTGDSKIEPESIETGRYTFGELPDKENNVPSGSRM